MFLISDNLGLWACVQFDVVVIIISLSFKTPSLLSLLYTQWRKLEILSQGAKEEVKREKN